MHNCYFLWYTLDFVLSKSSWSEEQIIRTKLRGEGAEVASSEAVSALNLDLTLNILKNVSGQNLFYLTSVTCLLAIIILILMSKLIVLKNTYIFRNYLDNWNYRVALFEDFNVPGFDCNYSFPPPDCLFCTKLIPPLVSSV
jgi:hypothetical protein